MKEWPLIDFGPQERVDDMDLGKPAAHIGLGL